MGWEVNDKRCCDTKYGRMYWARNTESRSIKARSWHWVRVGRLVSAGFDLPIADKTCWEVDWSHPDNNGSRVWARNTKGLVRSSREWHWVTTGYLRSMGINTPIYRSDSWEIDWSKRDGKKVLARNQSSKMPSSREWHWVDYKTISDAGIQWRPKNENTGRYIDGYGYVILTRRGMTQEEISLATEHGLFRGGRRKTSVYEHRLVAVKKYGFIPAGMVVRHINGIKTDNRFENIILGTTQENTMDHNTARLTAMFWREQAVNLMAILSGMANGK
jgi:hypothetical protein